MKAKLAVFFASVSLFVAVPVANAGVGDGHLSPEPFAYWGS